MSKKKIKNKNSNLYKPSPSPPPLLQSPPKTCAPIAQNDNALSCTFIPKDQDDYTDDEDDYSDDDDDYGDYNVNEANDYDLDDLSHILHEAMNINSSIQTDATQLIQFNCNDILFRNPDFSDVTIIVKIYNANKNPDDDVDDKKNNSLKETDDSIKIPAHKFIIIKKCPKFAEMITELENQYTNNISIEIINQSETAINEILRYIYCNKIFLTNDNIINVIESAKFLKMKSVIDLSIAYIRQSLNTQNIFQYLKSIENHIELMKPCKTYIRQNTKEILRSEEFLKITTKELKFILEMDTLACMEYTLFVGVNMWMEHQCVINNIAVNGENKRKFILENNCLYLIRFPAMLPYDFHNCMSVAPSLLTICEQNNILQYYCKLTKETNFVQTYRDFYAKGPVYIEFVYNNKQIRYIYEEFVTFKFLCDEYILLHKLCIFGPLKKSDNGYRITIKYNDITYFNDIVHFTDNNYKDILSAEQDQQRKPQQIIQLKHKMFIEKNRLIEIAISYDDIHNYNRNTLNTCSHIGDIYYGDSFKFTTVDVTKSNNKPLFSIHNSATVYQLTFSKF